MLCCSEGERRGKRKYDEERGFLMVVLINFSSGDLSFVNAEGNGSIISNSSKASHLI